MFNIAGPDGLREPSPGGCGDLMLDCYIRGWIIATPAPENSSCAGLTRASIPLHKPTEQMDGRSSRATTNWKGEHNGADAAGSAGWAGRARFAPGVAYRCAVALSLAHHQDDRAVSGRRHDRPARPSCRRP